MNYVPAPELICSAFYSVVLHYDDRKQAHSDLVCRQGNPFCDYRRVVRVASGVYCITNRRVMALWQHWQSELQGQLDARWFPDVKLKHNRLLKIICLRSDRFVTFCTFDRSVIFATIHAPNAWVSDLHDACDKFWSGAYSFSMIVLVRARFVLLCLIRFFSPTIEQPPRASQNPSSPSLGRFARDLHSMIATCQASSTPPLNLLEFLEDFKSTISQLLAKFAYFLLIGIWHGRKF